MTRRILLQLDGDPQPSSFDSVVALDAGAEHLVSFGNVTAEQAVGLTHGAIFTRSPSALSQTAIFVGGSDVARAEQIFAAVKASFVGPLRVSVMLDPNGANTTAAAAVRLVQKEMPLSATTVLVLGGTGPVGQRVARLGMQSGASVRLSSRNLARAQQVCEGIQSAAVQASGRLEAVSLGDQDSLEKALQGVGVIMACGAAGVQFLSERQWRQVAGLAAVVDLNAVPPLGLEGVQLHDKAAHRQGVLCFGALGVGGSKMKLHQAAIERLFRANNAVYDAEQVFDLAQQIL